jgi:hypothetical protein
LLLKQPGLDFCALGNFVYDQVIDLDRGALVEQPDSLDDVVRKAAQLDPDDRLRLIARLWASLPAEHWAAPISADRREVHSMIVTDDTYRMATLPQRIAWQVMGQSPPTKIYSAPRRFDLATIFVVTFAYSLFFAALSSLGTPPALSVIFGVFISVVAVGQALLYGGNNGRIASIITGAVAAVPVTWALIIWAAPRNMVALLILLAPIGAMVGAACGYLAGTLVGGVFLVADKLRVFFAKNSDEGATQHVVLVEADAEPNPHVMS